MATSKIAVSEGSGKNIGTHSISEDGVTKELQRVVPSNSGGSEIDFATEAKQDNIITALGSPAQAGEAASAATGLATAAKQLPDGHSVALSATDNAVLDAIQVGTDKIIAAPATEAKQLPDGHSVVLAAGTAAVGKLAANSGVDIGDVDVASIAAGDNNIGNVDIASAIPAGTNIIGAVKRDVVNYTVIRKPFNLTGAQTDGILWSPAAGKKWVVTDIIWTSSATTTLLLEEDKTAGDEAVMYLDLAANGGLSTNLQSPLFGTENDADLVVTTSAGNLKGVVIGYEI